VVRWIWVPGLGAALSSVGFGAIAAFGSLLFADQHWTPVWLAFSAYAVTLIAARLMFGHLPDKIGGARVALMFVLVETSGLVAMWLASACWVAAVGAALTGFGYSLVFPALGVEAVRRAPAEGRGVAMGAYTACLDLALGVSGRVLGLVASWANLSAVFLASAAVVFCAVGISLRLRHARQLDGPANSLLCRTAFRPFRSDRPRAPEPQPSKTEATAVFAAECQTSPDLKKLDY
jgi:MFS family permease